jgi:pimeloyl-ACP methyl ester carboxylesterase
LHPTRPRLLVIVPGNPGDACFYAGFLRELRQRGHEAMLTPHPCLPGPPADLLGCAQHQADAVRRHLADGGRDVADVDLVLVGHSLGAYLTYLIVRHALLPVARVILLFPFLTRPGWIGRLVLAALSLPWLVGLLLAALRGLPAALRRWLAHRFGGAELATEVLALVESPQVMGCVHLAVTERREIASRPDARYLFDHALFNDPEAFVTLLCRRDPWAPAALARLPGARLLPAPVGHAFVLDARQRGLVADAIHQILVGGARPEVNDRPHL